MYVSFYLSEFESRLEASESLEEKLNARLENAEADVVELKTADQGKEGKIEKLKVISF